VIDFVSASFVETAQRIVRQRSQVDDRVEAAEIIYFNVTNVLATRRYRRAGRTKVAASEKIRIETGYVVPRALQDTRHDRTNVSTVASKEYLHVRFEIAGIPGLMDAQPASVPTATSVLPKPVVISTSKESAKASLHKATGDSRYWALLFNSSSHVPYFTCRCPRCRRLMSVYVSRVPRTHQNQNVTNDPTEGTPSESMTNSKYTPGGARLALAGAATVSVFPATVNESGRNR
jgi:hypothetical protein